MTGMRIDFYDDPSQSLRAPQDVRINQMELSLYPDGRRVAVTFGITPFRQRPSIDLTVTNAKGEQAAALTVIETLDANLSLTVHLRDKQPANPYTARAELYYIFPEQGRVVVHSQAAAFNATSPDAQ
jgi:virulence-associated protein VagC